MWSYDQHTQHELELAQKTVLPSCYSRPHSIDAWRHRRMLESALPVVKAFPQARWLTVGDGGFGSDAFFLRSFGIDVTATSISTHTLEIAHAQGLIDKYAAENAEALSLPDNAVDLVLCKESFHHFPRPALAFYEMLRIAHKGVVLIEPAEGLADHWPPAKLSSSGCCEKTAQTSLNPLGTSYFSSAAKCARCSPPWVTPVSPGRASTTFGTRRLPQQIRENSQPRRSAHS